ncbi:MAG: metal ABC transporter substrate-binding protein, partial [Clostridia bacterium]
NQTPTVEGVEVFTLAPPDTGCLHDYQLTTADRKKLAQADLLVLNGAGMESFLEKVIAQLKIPVCDTSVGLTFITDADGEINPHVWVSLQNAQAQARAICEALSTLDGAHRAQYEQNLQIYGGKLALLDAQMREELAPFAGAKIITFHDAFAYWARDYGLEVAAVLSHEPGTAPSARALAEVIQIIRRDHVRALFVEPQYPTDSADVIARETGMKLYSLDPAVTGKIEPPDPDAYLAAMAFNLQTMKEALQ